MQLRHVHTAQPSQEQLPSGGFQKVTALAFSPDQLRLAVVTRKNVVHLFDADGRFRERFPTKPAQKGAPRNYLISSMQFNPDGSRLALGQSDSIVYVYKLGASWGEKKSICKKYAQPPGTAVTALAWPSNRPNEIVVGLSDGKLRIGLPKNNKSAMLYDTESLVTAIALSPDQSMFASGHVDGSVHLYSFPDGASGRGPSHSVIVRCNYVPYALAWGEHIAISGNAGLIQFVQPDGRVVQTFNLTSGTNADRMSALAEVGDLTCAAFNPSGQTVVFGGFDSLYTIVFDATHGRWKKPSVTRIPNLYTVTALQWRPDGSKIATGSLCGAVDMFDACLRRITYRDLFELTYTSPTSVTVRRMRPSERRSDDEPEPPTSVQVSSHVGSAISGVKIYRERYLVAHTQNTLIVADLDTARQTEVRWDPPVAPPPSADDGSPPKPLERFNFDCPSAAVVYANGKITVIEYGAAGALGSCLTERFSPHLVSVRITPDGQSKKLAFLLDQQTVRILDLASGYQEATIEHSVKIDWIELNPRGTKLLFRDKRHVLHLYDAALQERTTLLSYCNYVQWVPGSDVVVAQNRRTLSVWYSIDNPDQVTKMPIEGDVEGIERTAEEGTVVIADDDLRYPLDESLIAFGSAVDSDRNLERAAAILEALPPQSPGASGMWKRLSQMALEAGDFLVAERCFAALGDVAKASYLRRLNQMARDRPGGTNNYMVRAQLALFRGQVKRAESVFLQQGKPQEAIDMYRSLHKWDEAMRVARAHSHMVGSSDAPDIFALNAEYYEYLVNTRQEEVAGRLKETEGDYNTALDLYLRGGFPHRAAEVVLQQNMTNDPELLERVTTAMLNKRQYEQAGDFLERLHSLERALDCFRKGHAFRKAVDLARRSFPGRVVSLQEEWGDWLASKNQMEAASIHYTDAGAHVKAIHASIEARQWSTVVKILDHLDPEVATPFYRRVAQHYREMKDYRAAERYYLQGGMHQEAVQMYTEAELPERAHIIAKTYMDPEEVKRIFTSLARQAERSGKLGEAEKLFLAVEEPDTAIAMYKEARQYDAMLRLVEKYRHHVLPETHRHLANQFAREGNLQAAESHYLKANDWLSAVTMYRSQNMWSDALRCAKHGGPDSTKSVAYDYAMSIQRESEWKILVKMGLAEAAVEYALSLEEFSAAFHIAKNACGPEVEARVHSEYALVLEDEGQFAMAESEFIKGGKPREAMDMYINLRDWDAVMRVAEEHEPSAIPDVYGARGRVAFDQGNYAEAETYYVKGDKVETAIRMYVDLNMYPDAIRLANAHAPQFARQLEEESRRRVRSDPGAALVQQASNYMRQGRHGAAIDTYLQLDADKMPNINALAQHWMRATKIARDNEPSRAMNVAAQVGKRLQRLARHDLAADVLLQVGAYRPAIEALMQGGKTERALQVAEQHAPQLVMYVQSGGSAAGAVVEEGDGDVYGDGAGAGMHSHADPGTDMYSADSAPPPAPHPADSELESLVRAGDWKAVFERVSSMGSEVEQHYAAMHAKQLFDNHLFVEALSTLMKHGVAIVPNNFALYQRLAEEVLARTPDLKNEAADARVRLELREMLYGLVTELSLIDDGKYTKQLNAFKQLLEVAHLHHLYLQVKRQGNTDLAAKIATSLLRHTMYVPVDYAFHEAGVLARDIGERDDDTTKLGLAFIALNRFVDFTDAIVEDEAVQLDNSDFVESDIPSPFDVPKPDRPTFDQDERDEVHEYIVETAMSRDIAMELPRTNCDRCGVETYEASLRCHSCKTQWPPCVVTGYPVREGSDQVSCSNCNRPANRRDWNNWVKASHTCPWCSASATVQYS